MRELLLKRKGAFALYVFASFLFSVDDLFQIFAATLVFDAITKGDMQYFRLVAGISLVAVLFSGATYWVSRMLRIGYMKKVLLDIRINAFETVLAMSYKQFGKMSKETYLSRLTNDINMIEAKFFQSLLSFLYGMSMYIICFILIFIKDWKLGLGMLGVSLMFYSISRLFTKRAEHLGEEVSNENEHYTVNMSNTFNGFEIIKLGSLEERFLQKGKEDITRLEKKKALFNCYNEVQQYSMMFLSFGVMVGIIFYLGLQIKSGLGLPVAIWLFKLSHNTCFPIIEALPLLNTMKASSKIYNKITKLEEREQEEDRQEPFKFENTIEVKNLSFAYENRPIIQEGSFTIEKGKKYLIKGVSGSGKSTLMKLLGMVNEAYTGEIAVDGVSYKRINLESFNKRVAWIDQDIFLFEDSMRNNITLYKEVDEDVLQKAMQSAGLKGFVETIRLDEKVSENGKNLSGGQRQRLAIARALVKDTDILFVDEGTSSLNEKLGRQIEQALLALPQTVIAISHRYYEGISEQYDYVLEIQGEEIQLYKGECYFEGVSVC